MNDHIKNTRDKERIANVVGDKVEEGVDKVEGGVGKEVEGVDKVVEGGGNKVVEGRDYVEEEVDKVEEGGDKVIEGGDEVVEGVDKVVEGGDKVEEGDKVEGGGDKVVEGEDKVVEGEDKVVERGDKVEGGGDKVEPVGDRPKVEHTGEEVVDEVEQVEGNVNCDDVTGDKELNMEEIVDSVKNKAQKVGAELNGEHRAGEISQESECGVQDEESVAVRSEGGNEGSVTHMMGDEEVGVKPKAKLPGDGNIENGDCSEIHADGNGVETKNVIPIDGTGGKNLDGLYSLENGEGENISCEKDCGDEHSKNGMTKDKEGGVEIDEISVKQIKERTIIAGQNEVIDRVEDYEDDTDIFYQATDTPHIWNGSADETRQGSTPSPSRNIKYDKRRTIREKRRCTGVVPLASNMVEGEEEYIEMTTENTVGNEIILPVYEQHTQDDERETSMRDNNGMRSKTMSINPDDKIIQKEDTEMIKIVRWWEEEKEKSMYLEEELSVAQKQLDYYMSVIDTLSKDKEELSKLISELQEENDALISAMGNMTMRKDLLE